MFAPNPQLRPWIPLGTSIPRPLPSLYLRRAGSAPADLTIRLKLGAFLIGVIAPPTKVYSPQMTWLQSTKQLVKYLVYNMPIGSFGEQSANVHIILLQIMLLSVVPGQSTQTFISSLRKRYRTRISRLFVAVECQSVVDKDFILEVKDSTAEKCTNKLPYFRPNLHTLHQWQLISLHISVYW